MRRYKKILFLFFIIIISILGVFLYTTISKGNENENQKALSEVEYLEKKIVTLLNALNNIESRNYNLSVSEISEETEKSQSSQNSTGTEQTNNKQVEEQENTNSNNQDQKGEQAGEEKSEEYNLKEIGVLTNRNEIDWERIKTEVENLYSTVPTIILDLYSQDATKDEILGFNEELDNLVLSVKDENKQSTLSSLSNLYEYIPKFADKVTNNETYKAVIITKSKLFKAYSKLDYKNWTEIYNDVKQAIETYSDQLVSTNTDSDKQYTINKIYIMLNELQKATNLQDESVFLIKYKNILEEMNNL